MLNLGAKFKPTQPFMVPNFMVCKLQVCVEGVLNVLFTYTTQVPAQPSLAAALMVTVWVEKLVPAPRAVILRATVVVILSLLLAAYLVSV